MIIRLKRAIGVCMLASTLLQTVTAHSAAYYVAETGNNSNPGTEDKPFRTIAYAVDTMVAGDTTFVHGGTYNEGEIRFRRSGTSSSPIRLLNYPDESPIINFTGQTAFHRILIQHADGHNRAMGWITIDGFEIRNGYDGIKVYNLHDSTIRRNWIHDNRNQGILGNGTRVLIDRNIINHQGPFAATPKSNLEHGIYMHGTAITITNNLIYDNLGYGIQQNGSASSEFNLARHAGQEFASAENWIISNNTLAYSRNRAGMVVWGPRCNNARIENNIFYENAVTQSSSATQGIEFVSVGASGSPGMTIRNNHFFANGSGGQQSITMRSRPSDLVFTENIVNISNPAFVNAPAELPVSPNFSLTARSPAIDKGLSPSDETPGKTLRTAFDDALLKTRRTDFAGTTRPQGRAYDIGAYEYLADGDAQSPIPVQNVQIR